MMLRTLHLTYVKLKWCFTASQERPFRGLFSTAETFTKKNLRVHNHHSSRTLWRTSGSLLAQLACTRTNTCTHTHLGFCTLTNEIQSQASVFLISCYFAQFSKPLAVYLVCRHTGVSVLSVSQKSTSIPLSFQGSC